MSKLCPIKHGEAQRNGRAINEFDRLVLDLFYHVCLPVSDKHSFVAAQKLVVKTLKDLIVSLFVAIAHRRTSRTLTQSNIMYEGLADANPC